ncbi:MAG: tetratricopeptide repeat protein [Desulfobacteraceae bacterium]|jgi:tetratricopeptide (TPR) repeat protein
MAFHLSRKPHLLPHLLKTVAVVMIGCMGVFVFDTAGLCAPAPAPAAPELSAHEKQKLVRQAVAQYERKEIAKAKENLEKAQAVFPENYAVPYYLGLIYLEQGNRADAVFQWQKYVKMDPQSESALTIRKHLTLLLREQAREEAKRAVALEAALPAGPGDNRAIAVTSFRNLGSENLGPLGKGMAAMLISDLSQLPGLQVVDRIKLHALLEEIRLGSSGLVDSKTAPRVGRLLRARHVTSGSLADMKNERLIIASAVVDAYRKTNIGVQEAKGELKKFYDLEKEIACQIIEELGRDCSAAPAGFNKIHTRSMPALVAFSWGLNYFDEEKYPKARQWFQKALEQDPHFDLAAAALLATPTAAMISMDRSQMISTASANGLSSAVAGSAGAGRSTADPGEAESVGYPSVTTIIAGVAVVGGGVALAGGGGGGGGSSEQTSSTDLTGEWRGSWTDDTDTGEANFSLTQTGDAVSGSVTITGNDCLTKGSLTGTVSGTSATLSIQSDAETVSLSGTYDDSAKTLTGSWNFTASSSGCSDDTGEYAVTLTGDKNVDW